MKKSNWKNILTIMFLMGLVQACQATPAELIEPTAKIIEATVAPIEPTPTTAPTIAPSNTAPPPVQEFKSIGDSFSPELGSADYDVQNYLIQIKLDPKQKNYLEATVEIHAFSLMDPLSAISLD